MATVSETAGAKALDREILLTQFLEFCHSHDDQGPCSDIPMLARFLQRSAEVKEFLILYDLTLEQHHDLLEDACLALMQTESDMAPSKWDLNAVGIALRSAVHYHYILTTDAAEAALEAANEATGGVVAMEVTGQQAKVSEVTDQQAARKPGDCDPLNPEGLVAKAFVAQYGDNKPMMQQFWMNMGLQQALVQAQRRERAATMREAGELQNAMRHLGESRLLWAMPRCWLCRT
ncbi:TPA: hypothetical protein ACH3X1_013568 [Trebouxia sp. C0004]